MTSAQLQLCWPTWQVKETRTAHFSPSKLGDTGDRFVARVQEALTAARIQEGNFAGHSFRIGAAMTQLNEACQMLPFKCLEGGSSAYLLYIKIPGKVWLASPVPSVLLKHSPLDKA